MEYTTRPRQPLFSLKVPDKIVHDIQDEKLSGEEQNKKDPLHQLEAFQLFAYFTANIIKEEVIFTR